MFFLQRATADVGLAMGFGLTTNLYIAEVYTYRVILSFSKKGESKNFTLNKINNSSSFKIRSEKDIFWPREQSLKKNLMSHHLLDDDDDGLLWLIEMLEFDKSLKFC